MPAKPARPKIITETDGPFAGWTRWHAEDEGRFSDLIGPSWFKIGEDGQAICRAPTENRHANLQGHLHGGYLMAFVDQVLFAVARPSLKTSFAVTLTCNTEFVGAGEVGAYLDGTGEIMKETGKTIFIRGELSQGGLEGEGGERRLLCTFSGVLRKFPRPS